MKVIMILALSFSTIVFAYSKSTKKEKPWPVGVQDIKYKSSADNTMQPMMFYTPNANKSVPLLVYLHPWTATYKRPDGMFYAKYCIDNKWALCIPNFRGPNYNRSACGSEKVVKDIVSAVDYAKKHANIDSNRIYLIGVSGGGYAALLMAGRHPEIWAAVSAWVPIYNLADWYKYSKEKKSWYYRHLNNICGGAPGASKKVDAEYRKRSASTYLENAKGLNIEICAGLYDNTIPVSHTLRAFNALAEEADRVSKEDIEYMRVHKKIPEKLKLKIDDPVYKNKALFRRKSGNVRVTIFNGGHHIMRPAAIEYVKSKFKK